MTTWNTISRALKCLGNFEGFGEREPDIPVRLVPIDGYPDFLEVLVATSYGGYDTCYFDSDGDPTSIRDWIPSGPHREGIAVPKQICRFI